MGAPNDNLNAVKLSHPKYKPIGPAPTHLTKEQKQIWDETVSNCDPEFLGSQDRSTLEAYCTIFAEFRKSPANFATTKFNVLVKLQTQLGLSPLARSKVKAAKPKDEKDSKQKPKNPFASL